MKKVVVVGAGIAGLSLAYELKKRGHDVTLVEKTGVVGGLCRSFEHDSCILDVGVHLFYGKDSEVQKRVREVVPSEQWIRVKRVGKLYVLGRHIDWPIRLTSLLQLPFTFGLRVVADQLLKGRRALPAAAPASYQSELLKLYGPNLYYKFFHPLTGKFLQRNPAEVHADWAFSSLRAATKIEDKSFSDSYAYLPDSTDEEAKKDFNIFKFLKDQLTLDTDNEEFYYFRDGYGVLGESYRTAFEAMGGKLQLNSQVSDIVVKDGRVESLRIDGPGGEQVVRPDHFVWTGYLFDLCEGLKVPMPKLARLHSKFIFLYLKKARMKHQVCYYADDDISFSRGTILSNHSKTIIRNPHVQDVVCLEYTARERDDLKSMSAEVKPKAVRDAIKVGLMKDESELHGYHELDVANSYPILDLAYKEKLAALNRELKGFKNVWTTGRQGGFSYENADVLIKQSMHHELLKEL